MAQTDISRQRTNPSAVQGISGPCTDIVNQSKMTQAGHSTSDLRGFLLAFKLFDDRAVWAVVTTAGLDEMFERPDHLLKLSSSSFQLDNVRFCKSLHVRAAALLVAPKFQEFADLLEREPKITRPADEPQAVYGGVVIVSIAAFAANGPRHQLYRLIVADHLGRDA